MSRNQPLTLETILLTNDRRQMTALRPYLPPDYCQRAARLAYAHGQRVIITTGFFLDHLMAAETDGPPGALAIGRALAALGGEVTLVTDRYASGLLREITDDPRQVVEFPITGPEESRKFAQELIHTLQPTLVISVERCGITAAGTYLNARGRDISRLTARIDELFDLNLPSIGIGDGGNEIGMGKLAGVIASIPGLPDQPAVTSVDELVIASTSNWGAYGLVAALSALAGQYLLPKAPTENELIRRLYELGCYDGTCSTPVCGVDGFSLKENDEILNALSRWVSEQKSSEPHLYER